MKANYEDKIPQATSEVSLGNLYDINKQLMENEVEINAEVLAKKMDEIHDWLWENNTKYYMLLCHEQRDYTVFNLDKTSSWARMEHKACCAMTEDVIECLRNRGSLIALELQLDDTWECWIRNFDGCFAYYLFPYTQAVLEY
jgi:hypothetical protein